MSQASTASRLTFLDKPFPVLILLCMAAGLALAWAASPCSYLTQCTVLKVKGEQWFRERFTPILAKIQLTALIATLVLVFALKGEAILNAPELIGYMILPLALFFVTLFFYRHAYRLFRDEAAMEKSVTVGFHVTRRNFELSIALALTAFATSPLVVVSTVIGPLIEVPVMLSLAGIGRWLVRRFPLCCVPSEERQKQPLEIAPKSAYPAKQ